MQLRLLDNGCFKERFRLGRAEGIASQQSTVFLPRMKRGRAYVRGYGSLAIQEGWAIRHGLLPQAASANDLEDRQDCEGKAAKAESSVRRRLQHSVWDIPFVH